MLNAKRVPLLCYLFYCICKVLHMVTLGIVCEPFSGVRLLLSHLVINHSFELLALEVCLDVKDIVKDLFFGENGKPTFNDGDSLVVNGSNDPMDSFSLSLEDQNMPACRIFKCANKLLEYVSDNWRRSFVLLFDNTVGPVFDALQKRPYFLVIHLKTPTALRHERALLIAKRFGHPPIELSQLVAISDSWTTNSLYNLSNPSCIRYPDLTLLNNRTLQELCDCIDFLQLDKQEWIRPSWDTYFMNLAHLTSQRSNCMKRRVGAVIAVNRRVIATGYNGTPMQMTNCNEGGCARCNSVLNKCGEKLDQCICIHAEENALMEAGRARADGGIVYCTTCPCLGCAKKVIQVGIKEVVYSNNYGMDQAVTQLFGQAGIIIRRYTSVASELGRFADMVIVNKKLMYDK